jgi:hypothetical protein
MESSIMKQFTRISLMMLCASFAGVAMGYNYTFVNNTDSEVEVSLKLSGVAEPTETARIAAGATYTFSFRGLRIGLCVTIANISCKMQPIPGESVGKEAQFTQESMTGFVCGDTTFKIFYDFTHKLMIDSSATKKNAMRWGVHVQ